MYICACLYVFIYIVYMYISSGACTLQMATRPFMGRPLQRQVQVHYRRFPEVAGGSNPGHGLRPRRIQFCKSWRSLFHEFHDRQRILQALGTRLEQINAVFDLLSTKLTVRPAAPVLGPSEILPLHLGQGTVVLLPVGIFSSGILNLL